MKFLWLGIPALLIGAYSATYFLAGARISHHSIGFWRLWQLPYWLETQIEGRSTEDWFSGEWTTTSGEGLKLSFADPQRIKMTALGLTELSGECEWYPSQCATVLRSGLIHIEVHLASGKRLTVISNRRHLTIWDSSEPESGRIGRPHPDSSHIHETVFNRVEEANMTADSTAFRRESP